MGDVLLELFCEEIPASMQKRAAQDLQSYVTNALVEAGLTYSGAASFVTPRRLCLMIEGLSDQTPALREERKGPRVNAPPKAIEGFSRSVGLSKDQLDIRDDKKGQFYFAIIEKPTRHACTILAEVIPEIMWLFPWPKSMRWGNGKLRWVRPLHSILCIFSDKSGTQIIPFNVDGIISGDVTYGHRFMAPEKIHVQNFDEYRQKLQKAFVMLDSSDRENHILEDAKNIAFSQGLELIQDRKLLSEIAGLVEWPVVLMGNIADDFLELPAEVLKTSMKEHQKFFSVKNPKTGCIEKFITVANRLTRDDGATILAGNQKVLSARLSDAKFFWENDLRIANAGMDEWHEKLSYVTFHNKLGSQAERIGRMTVYARELSVIVGANCDQAELAAKIAKVDLASEMVYEFPELQGVMGRYYATTARLPDAVAYACEEHYSPLGPSDDVPCAPVSVAVALADRFDMLNGFWVINEKPTGSKDPFALRRAALGVIRLILHNKIRLSLLDVFKFEDMIKHVNAVAHRNGYKPSSEIVDPSLLSENLLSFIHDRLKVYLRDRGIRHDVIDACLLMPSNDDLTLLVNRAEAVQNFLETSEGKDLLQGFKRANNILSAEEKKDGVFYELEPDLKFTKAPAEKTLIVALEDAKRDLADALKQENFSAAMRILAKLRIPIDLFFQNVQVNSAVRIERRNRLCLLNQIRTVMNSVADFSTLEG